MSGTYEKLTLLDIVGYLPYDLEILYAGRAWIMDAQRGTNNIPNRVPQHTIGIYDVVARQNQQLPPLPLLRPLQSLVNSLVWNGNIITPFLEIPELVGEYQKLHGSDRDPLDNNANGWAICNRIHEAAVNGYTDSDYHPENFFSYASVQKLMQYHFDFKALIPQEKAMSIKEYHTYKKSNDPLMKEKLKN